MNDNLQNFARNELKKGLAQCTEGEQHFFKRMYARGDLELSIDEVVDNMLSGSLDWAMQQVEGTLAKHATAYLGI